MKRGKLSKLIASTLIAVSVLALNPIVAHAEWRSDSKGWWYKAGDSYYTGWHLIDGIWYYFYTTGYMAHDTTVEGYYLNGKGMGTNVYYEQRVNAILAEIIKDGMTEKQKVKAIHDWIINNTEYDKTYKIHDGYETLVNGKGVCQGYAELAKKMFTQAGINSIMISGKADNGTLVGSHAWNLVNINGKWRHVDVTWDDPIVNGEAESTLRYDYFNLTDKDISEDHTWNTSMYPAAD